MPVSCSTARATASTSAFMCSSSWTVATSGIMISGRGSPPARTRAAAASRMARACMPNSPGMTMPRRTPRSPSIGFSSCIRRTAASMRTSRLLGLPAASATATFIDSSVKPGRNSCRGGSIRRMVTGSPSIASRIATKSSRCSGMRASRALCCPLASEARIRCSTSSRRSPRNMCSVRHSPMPSAPKRRARVASAGVSALARTPSRRVASACSMSRATEATTESVSTSSDSPSNHRTTRESLTGTSPRKTSPVVPSMEITSPSRTSTPDDVRNRPPRTSTSRSSAPHTHVRPMPRATTAACEVLPPREVRMPAAATMPDRSSGLVSRRTRMTLWPSSAHSTAVAESKAALPTAAPGEAFIPLASSSLSVAWSNCGNISLASCCPVTRRSASSRSISPWSTSCTAMRKAAAAVRLPTLVCSIQSLPCSMVNSMSQRSL